MKTHEFDAMKRRREQKAIEEAMKKLPVVKIAIDNGLIDVYIKLGKAVDMDPAYLMNQGLDMWLRLCGMVRVAMPIGDAVKRLEEENIAALQNAAQAEKTQTEPDEHPGETAEEFLRRMKEEASGPRPRPDPVAGGEPPAGD